jgi:hypothetical protein
VADKLGLERNIRGIIEGQPRNLPGEGGLWRKIKTSARMAGVFSDILTELFLNAVLEQMISDIVMLGMLPVQKLYSNQ